MINKLYVELSSSCNLNCKMCFRNNWFSENVGLMSESTVHRLREIIESLKINTVFFGGMGEPLVHKDLVPLVRLCTEKGIKSEVITNATLLKGSLARELVFGGINRVWVSLDGFSRESYEEIRRGSIYDEVIKNIKEFNRLRRGMDTKLGITFVIMKENVKEFEKINGFCDGINADIINISHLVPPAPLKKEDALYDDRNYTIGKSIRYKSGIKSDIKKNSCPFIEENSVFIKYDGSVSPCMQLLHNSYNYYYEECRKVYSASFGNINSEDFKNIYNGKEYTEFRKRVKDFDFPCCTICMGCTDRKENKTDCMYNPFPTCGACLWAQGYIRCP